MDKIKLLELINKGKFSFVEFKADTPDIKAETIGEHVACFANSKDEKWRSLLRFNRERLPNIYGP